MKGVTILIRTFFITVVGLGAVAFVLTPTGFFGPLSSRVRGLFVKHTRTGNPLVDSVAEHQPASADALWHYLHWGYYAWQVGTGLYTLVLVFGGRRYRAGASFMVAYSCAVYYFALRMARLIILSGPIASCCVGAVLGGSIDWAIAQFFWPSGEQLEEAKNDEDSRSQDKSGGPLFGENLAKIANRMHRSSRTVRLALAVLLLAVMIQLMPGRYRIFEKHCEDMSESFSNPRIMIKARLNNGQTIILDDYREAYFWLRDKTPEDSRVMAWWDYGYQITGIGNRTSIADGNTWNHEHIATLGKCLTSPVKEAHSLIRHLADYVLIWSGGGGDDLAKSPHMARIGNSVYRDICPKDPLCMHFGFQGPNHENPTPMMRRSLLYNLHAHNTKPGVHVDSNLFQEAYTTKYGLVRIFKVMNVSQESKDWLADPANRICDAPGSWYCTGQYPPAQEIQDLLAKRRDFGQLEDFNRKNRDDDYHRAYMQRMGGGAH